ncbi:MAG: glycosyltransferase [Cyanobium sp. M30B3]|nr:MAG: glycosyltransferase [Cyanobium sp. M30B3]
MNILAIIAVRNESLHVRRCIDCLVRDGIEIALIDHESSDGTREIAEQYLGNGVQRIIDLAWEGCFSLEKQLVTKQTIIDGSKHEWVAHFDADEWPVAPSEFGTLKGMAEQASESGYNVINFNEFVFLPLPGESFERNGYENLMKYYYFFEPQYPRLQRMWRRDCNLSNVNQGGHLLSGGNPILFPFDGYLRHYIALSEEHAIRKYAARKFADRELARGWHANRVDITTENIRGYFGGNTINHCRLMVMEDVLLNRFDKSDPQSQHFWEWTDEKKADPPCN